MLGKQHSLRALNRLRKNSGIRVEWAKSVTPRLKPGGLCRLYAGVNTPVSLRIELSAVCKARILRRFTYGLKPVPFTSDKRSSA
jgi:hypothetical protein